MRGVRGRIDRMSFLEPVTNDDAKPINSIKKPRQNWNNNSFFSLQVPEAAGLLQLRDATVGQPTQHQVLRNVTSLCRVVLTLANTLRHVRLVKYVGAVRATAKMPSACLCKLIIGL